MASFFRRNFTTGLLIGCIVAIGVAAAAATASAIAHPSSSPVRKFHAKN